MEGQSVITRTVTVAECRFAPGHLGERTQLVPLEMVEEALTESGRVQSRIRALPSRVVGLPPAGRVSVPRVGLPEVWHRLVAGLGGLDVANPTAGALSQGRRVASTPLRFLFDLLRGPAAGVATTGVRWRGGAGHRDRRHRHERARQ